MRPILTVERTAAFMPAAGAPTFITATVCKPVCGEGSKEGVKEEDLVSEE